MIHACVFDHQLDDQQPQGHSLSIIHQSYQWIKMGLMAYLYVLFLGVQPNLNKNDRQWDTKLYRRNIELVDKIGNCQSLLLIQNSDGMVAPIAATNFDSW